MPARSRGAPTRRGGLLLGTALGGLLPAFAASAGAPAPFSAAWFAQHGAAAGGDAAAAAAARAATPNNPANYAQVRQSLADLQRAAGAISSIRQMQAAARAAVATSLGSSVANGLVIGGLQPDSGLAAPGVSNPTPTWTGAGAPIQTGSAGAPTVTVRQLAPTALLNWNSFNVGARTTLAFDQSAGGAQAGSWVVLNRVSGDTASTILGTITAPGHVLILNGNGILFGPTASVNVGALVASTADIPNARFAATGIYGAGATVPSFTGAAADVTVAAGAQIATTAPLTATSAGGGVILLGRNVSNAGSITTAGGQTILGAGTDFVLRPGFSVSGTGTVTLADGSTVAGALVGNVTSTTLGSEIAVTRAGAGIDPNATGNATNTGIIEADQGDVTLAGHAVTQGGVVLSSTSFAQRGTIHLLTDLADGTGRVTVAPGALTAVVPDTGSTTATDAQLETDLANSATANGQRAAASLLNDQTDAADTQYESRIEISSGGTIDFAPGSLTMATGGQIVATSPARVETEAGAILDVSGSVGVTLPMSANDVTVDVQGFEERDDALNRDAGTLFDSKVDVDTRDLVSLPGSATADQGAAPYDTGAGRLYTAGGLLEVSGEVGNVPHTIGEFTAAGGSILLTGNGAPASTVVAQSGSVFNLAGGTVSYAPGLLAQSWLIGPGGVLTDVNSASGAVTYSGVYDGIVQSHVRWNVKDTYTDPLIAPSEVFETGYTIGRDAGALTVSAPTVLFNATVDAGAVNGQGQVVAPAAGVAAVLQGQNAVAEGGGLQVGRTDLYGLEGGFASTVSLSASPLAAADALAPADGIPTALGNAVTLDPASLGAGGLATLAIATTRSIDVAAPVTLGDGGALVLAAPAVTVGANLLVHGGSVTLGDLVTIANPLAASTSGATVSLNPTPTGAASSGSGTGTSTGAGLSAVTLAAGATIDVSGSFTNALLDPVHVAGRATEAGGTVTIDTTGGVDLQPGSLIDASAGAAVGSTGAITAGAAGGTVSVIGDDPNAVANDAGANQLALTVNDAPVRLGGTIRAVGGTGGGAFVLRAPAVLVTAVPADAAGRTLLVPSFFASGFDSYTIDGYGTAPAPVSPNTPSPPPVDTAAAAAIAPVPANLLGVEIAAGVPLAPVVPVYAANGAARLAPTGTSAATLFTPVVPALIGANQTTATIEQRVGASLLLLSRVPLTGVGGTVANEDIGPGGAILVDPGASIAVDPLQSVTLEAIGQITVDGRITAHGGSITLQNDTYEPGNLSRTLEYTPGLSIWVGSDVVLDVSGQAATAPDLNGRLFGNAPAGGTIRIGGAVGFSGGDDAAPLATSAAVVIRPGALLDASGSTATIDAAAGQPLLVAPQPLTLEGAGGVIDVNSETGIALDGIAIAAAGGAQVPGGSLVVDLVHPIYGGNATTPLFYPIPDALTTLYSVFLDQNTEGSGLPANLAAGNAAVDAIVGAARVSAQQVSAGGFANLTIGSADYPAYGPDVLRFDGSVTLAAAESISLPAVLADRDADAAVVLAAPLVTLNSNSNNAAAFGALGSHLNAQFPYATGTGLAQTVSASEIPTASTLLVSAGTIALGIGGVTGIHETVPLSNDTAEENAPVTDEPGFAATVLRSTGDVVLEPPADYPGGVTVPTFASNGDVLIEAARTYVAGAPGANYVLSLGLDTVQPNPAQHAGTLTLLQTPGTIATAPLYAETNLSLSAARIVDAGAIEQPFGSIVFGSVNGTGGTTDSVAFLPGSLTSVSGAGLTELYGGTPDGVNYASGATSLTYSSTVTPAALLDPQITFAARSVAIAAGATLDLRGGGTLAGAGFNSGRGGSTDALVTPFTTFAGGIAAQPADAIYAVIPGTTGATPLLTDTFTAYTGIADAAPAMGSTITLARAAGGLPAGTYTLLPAYDALLPGGYRIEVTANATTQPLLAQIGNLSTATAATFGVAGTPFRSTEAEIVDVTPGSAVRQLSSYDEEDYATYVTSVASLFGLNRIAVPADSGGLLLDYTLPMAKPPPILDPQPTTPFLSVAGSVLFAPAAGGYGGTVTVETATAPSANPPPVYDLIDVAPGSAAPPLAGNQVAVDPALADTVVLGAADLDRLGAASLDIGVSLTRSTTVNEETVASYLVQSNAVTVEKGAVLDAGEVVLGGATSVAVDGGATIDTVGRGPAAYAPPAGTAVTNAQVGGPSGPALLDISNSTLNFATPASGSSGSITVGSGAVLASAGSIGFETAGTVNIGGGTLLATADLSLALSTLNITAGTALPAGAVAPSGVTLTQGFLDNLLTGANGLGPPLTRAVFTASNAVDFYGTVQLTLGTGGQTLELNTPSIYGYGTATDVATVSAGTIVWNGIATGPTTAAQPAGVLAAGAGSGSGTLDLAAGTIILGYGPNDFVPANAQTLALPRATYGFANVDLDASTAIVANGDTSLAAFQSQGAYAGTGYANTGGALNLRTPLLTTGAGATLALVAGGPVSLGTPGGTPGAAGGLGGEIDIAGASIAIADTVALPEGKLVLTAAGDIALAPGAALSLPGVGTSFFDVTRYGPAGSISMESTAGDITADAASSIGVSAAGGAAAGTLNVSALAGTVSLAGAINGAGTDGALGGGIGIRAGTLADFAGLNARLTAGGVFGTRAFEIGTGDLDITSADTLRAHTIGVSLDGGALTVDGLVDASGASPGSISLSAASNLLLTADAVLDAHGTVPQTDSTGATIDSENRALVTLRVADGPNGADLASTAANGTLTLARGATIDVSAAPGVACSGGALCGDVELDAPRTGSATSGGVAVSAAGPVDITGAGTVALNAFWTYVPAGGVITQAVLGGYGADATAFIGAALNGSTLNPALAAQIGGLASTPGFHLRPGIEIDSSTAGGGDLIVAGDLDLSGLRYASLDPTHQVTATAGSGEPGVLVLRAANDLAIYGSITDGFDQPVETAAAPNPDDNGWLLDTTAAPDVSNGTSTAVLDVNLVVPATAGTITLASGTMIPANATLNYAITVGNASLAAGTVLPTSITLANPVTLAGALVAQGNVLDGSGNVVFGRGTLIPAGTVLPASDSLAAGFVLPASVSFAATNALTGAAQTWPAGASLFPFGNNGVTLAANTALTAGDVIPTGTTIASADGSAQIALRSMTTLENGLTGQGEIYAAGAQLPAGLLSWSYDFVSGGNTAAADPGALQPATALAAAGQTGNTTLSDLHFQELTASVNGSDETSAIEAFSVIRTGTGSIGFSTGGNFDESTVYGIYTAGTRSAGTDGTGYDQPVGTTPVDPVAFTAYAAADAAIHADYATGGGNLAVNVQGSLATTTTAGLFLSDNEVLPTGATDSTTGEWLFRQGDGTTADPGAWWVNFGSYVPVALATGGGATAFPFLLGFTGFGTLGGGNLAITVGGTAGTSAPQSAAVPNEVNPIQLPDTVFGDLYAPVQNFSLYAAVASTGRLDPATGAATLTGGGTLSLAVGGALDPGAAIGAGGSTIVAMRGNAAISAASAGVAELGDDGGPSVADPYIVTASYAPTLILGDAAASIDTRGAIALAGVGDPTRTATLEQSANGDVSWFSLWDATTSVSLTSAGGDISPFNPNSAATEGNTDIVYPPILNVTAASGSIVYNPTTTQPGSQVALVAAPSPRGVVDFFAANSIVGDDSIDVLNSTYYAPAIDVSGADPAGLPSVSNPAYLTIAAEAAGSSALTGANLSMNAINGLAPALRNVDQLFVLTPDATTSTIHTDGAASHFYANSGDVEHLVLGQTVSYAAMSGVTPTTQYVAAMPSEVRAGNDVVSFGGTTRSDTTSTVTGGLLWNDTATDISLIDAGGSAYFVNTQIAGPGTLELTTGANLYQGGDSVVESIGTKVGAAAGNTASGASILVATGITAADTDFTAFANLYLDPANLANPALTLAQQPGTVERTYGDQLLGFLQARGYSGGAAGALAAFGALPLATREILLLQVYYSELNQSGLDYNDAGSRFFHSYDEGDEAISTLFPQTDLSGIAPASGGGITLFGGSGFRTDFGGNIEIAAPDGPFTVGVTGATPPATAGVITQGFGDVDIYTYGSIPLGESRIFTTFGGNILLWMSSDGVVNAGEGAASTVLFTPPDITYDALGDITLSPTVPSTGAGIATLSPVSTVPAGNVNVVTPVGTVDVGEAGIRSSGNVNVAALVVVNAANITAGGAVTGVPVVAVPNVTATAAASAAAAATSTSASSSLNRSAAQQAPSVITVEVTGGDTASDAGGDDQKRKRKG